MIATCTDCGEEKQHYAKGLCSPCYHRLYYRECREEKLAYQRRYRAEHHKEYLAYLARWRQENPDYQRRKVVCAECGREKPHHAKGLCQVCYNRLNWKGDSPERQAARNARRLAHKRNVPCTLTSRQLEEEFKIARTLYPGEDLHIHHLIPLSKGGGTTLANIQVIPGALNLAIGDRLPGEIYKQLTL